MITEQLVTGLVIVACLAVILQLSLHKVEEGKFTPLSSLNDEKKKLSLLLSKVMSAYIIELEHYYQYNPNLAFTLCSLFSQFSKAFKSLYKLMNSKTFHAARVAVSCCILIELK